MAAPATTLTAEQWRDSLDAELEGRKPRYEKYEHYYCGEHPLAFAMAKYREAFGAMLSAQADNWCPIVIESSVERLDLQGFEFGDAAVSKKANDIWQLNGLDAEAVIAHTEAVKNGVSYLLVEQTDEGPRVTVEHPLLMIVRCDPANRRKRIAALKKWRHDGYLYCTLWLPDAIYTWVSQQPVSELSSCLATNVKWNPLVAGAPNPFGVVPVVAMENNPHLLHGGRSDLVDVIPLQDRLNKQVCDLIITAEFQAFRQRVVIGAEVPKDPETNKPVQGAMELKQAISRLWWFEPPENGSPNVTVQELEGADLGPLLAAIEQTIREIAALSRTPPHYLLGQMVNVSSDALLAAETALVNKVKKKMLTFGQAWEDVMRLCLVASGMSGALTLPGRTQWANPASVNPAQYADAAVKAVNAGMPYEAVYQTFFGQTPEVARQWAALRGLPSPDDAGDLSLSAQRLGLAIKNGVMSQEEARSLIGLDGAGPDTPSA